MFGTRLTLALVFALGLSATALPASDRGGLFHRKARPDPARVRLLIDIVRADPDAKKRAAAVTELVEADPRIQVDVIPALVTALRQDPSEAVRRSAAEVIGRFNVVFPVAGLALEDALATDSSRAVRNAAKDALWEYHVLGYRSAKGTEAFATQTAEPPIARPPAAAEPLTSEPPTAPAAVVASGAGTPTIAPLPPVGPPPGPVIAHQPPRPGGLLSAIQPHPNLTVEPPLARRSPAVVSIPKATAEPPFRPRFFEPIKVITPPRYADALPPIVPDPGPLPGVTPLPTPTAEPPLAKSGTGR